MSDSFFGFDTNLEPDTLDEGLATDEEDEDYDALNDETFGEDILNGDWEEDHEKLAELTELSRHGGKEGNQFNNGDIRSKLASFLLDDDPLPIHYESIDNVKSKPRPPPGFWVNNGQPDIKPSVSPMKFQGVCTVEELERNLIKPLTHSVRLEDLERKLISPKSNPPGLPGSLRAGPPFSNLAVQPPPRQSIIASSIPKVAHFPHYQIPPPHLIMPPGFVGLRSGLNPLSHNGPPHQMYVRLPHSVGPTQGPHLPFNRGPPEDEYAGLMTNNEKQWLVSIQLVQLSTSTPFQDDYYFIMYQQRQSGHHGRKLGCPLKGARENQNLVKHSYTPLQFENSLGKLQVGSVTAPRKIIDTDIVENIECTSAGSSSKKIKQILLEIEHMFSDVLLAEEALSPYATHSTDDINPNLLLLKTVKCLLKSEKLKAVLNIRKGKTLVLRIMSHHEVSSPLAHKLITILPIVARRDLDQAMLRTLPAIRHHLASVNIEILEELSTHLSPELPFLLSNKFGISVLTNMIERAENCMSQLPNDPSGWIKFVSDILSVCSSVEIEKPVVGICGPTLSRHLARCDAANNQHIVVLHKALSNTVN